ncbi:MAG: hypothetical protein GY795_37510 [Desulfobacterales bacterium]|nr:hypothetical protein [Desulfobacterales bacterium]
MDAVETTITEHIFNQAIAESRKEIAVNLLKMGMDANFVSQATGLSEEEIKQLNVSSQRLQV